MAGEIQLNSTTMATESSGSITAQLDTIRPNTTNGSLTLQGDSSNAGVTGLTIDSSGNAAFAQTISGGTIGSGVAFPAGPSVSGQVSGGHILQVQSTILTGTISDNTNTTPAEFTDLTGLLVKITPSSTSSKVLLNYNFTVGQSAGNNPKLFRIKRTISGVDNTSFAVGASSGTRTQATSVSYDANADLNGQVQHSFSFVDQPSADTEITYQLQLMHNISPFTGHTVYIGEGANNQAYNQTSPIIFIAMELV
jgi:hypothetical protein